jgi:hypothetical protein
VRAASARLASPRALPAPSAGAPPFGQASPTRAPPPAAALDDDDASSRDSSSSSSSSGSRDSSSSSESCPVFELAQLEEVFHVALGKPLGLVFEEVAPG